MKSVHATALALVIVGGINWGLVALAEFDLVAWIFGEEFGSTNVASRIVYGLVGVSAIVVAASLAKGRAHTAAHNPTGAH